MSEVKLILDAGSTHMGKKAYAMELIDIAQECRAVCKFQLFPAIPEFLAGGNVHLSMDLFKELYSYAMSKESVITASTFGPKELEFLMGFDVPFIKFGYSQRDKLSQIKGCLDSGRKVIVSTDLSQQHMLPKHPNLVKLYVKSEGAKYYVDSVIHFEGIFPTFDGFSDHTLGVEQTMEAVARGANWIEKHIKLEYDDVDCPDATFALSRVEAVKLAEEIRRIR